jgi:DNA-binding MarR family transcriptional regulator
MIVSSHEDLVKGLPADKGNLSRSLRTLAERGWIVIGRSPGGKAQHVTLTPEGSQRASEIVKKW